VVRDLRANISAEAGARQTYGSLIKACDDEGTKKTLHHLLTREITHANMFMKALYQLGKLDDPFFGNIRPTKRSSWCSIWHGQQRKMSGGGPRAAVRRTRTL
jgi:Mn-containing catalase